MNYLTINYNNVEIDDGQQIIKHNITIKQPSIQIRRKPNLLYCLFMVDTNAEPKDFLHWLVVNIDRTNYQDIVSYYPPDPPSGTHNYVFYFCEQPKPLRLKPISGRSGFNSNQFIQDYHLTVLDRKSFKARAGF